jgi:hypothetical protein
MNRYDTNASFVMADQSPAVATPETSLLRRQDVVEASTAVIRAYSEQQNALLGRLQEDVVGGGSAGFLSNADQVAERRKTSGMYLRSYLLVSAMTTGGLAYLAHLAGADQAAAAALAANAERQPITIGKERFDEEAVTFACLPEQAEALVQIVRTKYRRDQIRIWRNDTGAASAWRRV